MWKNRLWGIVFAAISMLSVADFASASLVNSGDTVLFTKGFGTTSGGEFIVHKRKPDLTYTGELYRTFCLELNENIGTNQDYYVYDVSSDTDLGGLNVGNSANGGVAAPSPDPLDGRTAWLFQQFAKGTLTNYDYANAGGGFFADRNASANALQRAIWYIEDELTDLQWAALSPVQQYYYGLASSQTVAALNRALGAVRVVNIHLPGNSGALRQSSLVLIPEPGALMVWGGMMGISACGLVLLKRFKTPN
jgi:hypothetical protein